MYEIVNNIVIPFYRWGNPEELELYKHGVVPTQENGNSVHFSTSMDGSNFYKYNKNLTHSKNNSMSVLYKVYIPTTYKYICTSRKKKKCQSLFFPKEQLPKVENVEIIK